MKKITEWIQSKLSKKSENDRKTDKIVKKKNQLMIWILI